MTIDKKYIVHVTGELDDRYVNEDTERNINVEVPKSIAAVINEDISSINLKATCEVMKE